MDSTAESLELAYKILQRANEDEKKCTGWEFIQKGAKYLKKCPFDDDTVGLLNGLFSQEVISLSRSMTVPLRQLLKRRSET